MGNAQNPDLAAEFIELLLSDTGIKIFEVVNGQPCVKPAKCDNKANLPSSLNSLVVDM
jgi:ABC-type Fe3+ transport system substrate-binding protein